MKFFILLLLIVSQSVQAQAPTWGLTTPVNRGTIDPVIARFCTIIMNEGLKNPPPSSEELRSIIATQQGDAVLSKIKSEAFIDIYSSARTAHAGLFASNRQKTEDYCYNKTKDQADNNPPEMLPQVAVDSAAAEGANSGSAGGGEGSPSIGVGGHEPQRARRDAADNVYSRYGRGPRRESRQRSEDESIGAQLIANTLNNIDECGDENSCGLAPGMLDELQASMDSVENILQARISKCPCLNMTVQKNFGEPAIFEQHKTVLKFELQNKILDAFSKKFLNDYAANVEDVNFFSAKVSKFFGRTEAEQKKNAEEMQCSQPEKYLEAISRKCGSNLDENKMRRLDSIFGVFGKNTAGSSLAEKLQGTNKLISVLDDTTRNTSGHLYTRADHDAARYSFTRTKPQYRLTDMLIKKAMRDRRFRNIVMESGNPPFETLSEELMKAAKANPETFLQGLIDIQELGDETYLGLVDQIKKAKEGENPFREAFSFSMGLHPGMEAILLNNKLLDEATRKAKRNNVSVTHVLENDIDILGKKFRESCDRLKQDLAEAVCMEEADLLKNVSAKTVENFFGEEETFKKKFAKLLICEAGSENQNAQFLDDLEMKNPLKKSSDFLDRMTQPVDKQTNAFRMMVKALNDNEFKEDVRNSMEFTYGQGSSVNSSNLASSAYGGSGGGGGVSSAFSSAIGFDEAKAAEKAAQLQAATFNPAPRESASTSDITASAALGTAGGLGNLGSGVPDQGLYSSNVVAPVIPGGTPEDKTTAQIRRELRDYMSNESNREQVDSMIGSADPKVLEELAKLKEEAARNREKLLELANENEKLKLKSVQDQLNTLEQKRAQKITEAIQAPAGNESSEREGTTAGVHRGVASIAETAGVTSGSLLNGGNQAGAATTGGASTSSSGNGAGAGTISGGSGNASNALNAMSMSGTEPLIISSASARASSGEIKSTELSLELLSYLEKNEPDLQTLMKIRNSGMIYKYRVLEDGKYVEKEILVDYKSLNEDVKKLIDQKIADSGVGGPEITRLNDDIKKLRRTHSFATLKIILGEQMRKTVK